MNTIEGDLWQIYAGGQAFRIGRTNVAYLDLHVAPASGPFRGLHASESLLRDPMGFPANGFLSDDDSAYNPR